MVVQTVVQVNGQALVLKQAVIIKSAQPDNNQQKQRQLLIQMVAQTVN